MKPGSVRWTIAEEEAIRRFVARQFTCAQAAAELKRNVESTRSKAEAMGLKFKSGRIGRVSHAQVTSDPKFVRPEPPRYASRMAMILGDPPIGRSALDQKRGQA